MRKIIFAICAVVVLAVSSMPIYAEESASSKHRIELGLSDGSSLVDQRLISGHSFLINDVNKYAESNKTRSWMLPPIALRYYYQVLPWLEVGGEIGAKTNSVMNIYNQNETSPFLNYSNTALFLTAGIRFSFYKTDFVQLYSGLNVGARLNIESQNSTIPYNTYAPHVGSAGFTFQATAFGVRFGKQVYGLAELGYGYKGILTLGVGTRL